MLSSFVGGSHVPSGSHVPVTEHLRDYANYGQEPTYTKMEPTYRIDKKWSAAGINKVSALGSANFGLGFALPDI